MEWIQILGPTLLVIIGGIISWLLKSRSDEYRTVKEKLNQEQREIYKKILTPYLDILASTNDDSQKQQIQTFSVKDLRKNLFELDLVGSDRVIRAFNKTLRHAYENEKSGNTDYKQILLLFGNLLLEIRKSLGLHKTKLKPREMFEGLIKDIEKLD